MNNNEFVPRASGNFALVKDTDGEKHVLNVLLIQEFYFPSRTNYIHVVGSNYTIKINQAEYDDLMEAIYHLS